MVAEEHFKYYSNQVHSTKRNGHTSVRRNIVDIKNGTGKKVVEIMKNGKTKKYEKNLSKDEITKIRSFQFIPRLFKDCVGSECTSKQRNKGTRKNRRNQTRRG